MRKGRADRRRREEVGREGREEQIGEREEQGEEVGGEGRKGRADTCRGRR